MSVIDDAPTLRRPVRLTRPSAVVSQEAAGLPRSTKDAIAADPGTGAPGAAPPTYQALSDALADHKDRHNLRSRLHRWMDAFEKGPDDALGDELGAGYAAALGRFRDALLAHGEATSTVKTSASRMNAVRRIAAALVAQSGTDRRFGEVLAAAVRNSGRSANSILVALGFGDTQFRFWMAGKTLPDRAARGRIPELEALLGLPIGTLSSLLPETAKSDRRRQPTTELGRVLTAALGASSLSVVQAARRVNVPAATLRHWARYDILPSRTARAQYLGPLEVVLGLKAGTLEATLPALAPAYYPYRAQFTDAQQLEWDRFYRFKTHRAESRATHRPRYFWKVRRDGRCSAGDKFRDLVRGYYGFLGLRSDAEHPWLRGLGRDAARASLLDLADAEAVIAFFEFLAGRTGFTDGSVTDIRTVAGLLERKVGYLWQAHGVDLAVAVGKAVPSAKRLDEWRARCEAAYERLTEFAQHLVDAELVEVRRDYSHIARILDSPRPLDALVLLEQRLDADYDATARHLAPGARALLLRNRILVKMMMRNPLRAYHWSAMTYRADNTGHLRRMPDGRYRLFYDQDEFKALAEFRDGPYNASVSENVTALLDQYLAVDRHHLLGANDCAYVFRPLTLGTGDAADAPIRVEGVIASITKRHLADWAPRGMRPHAVRHIVATHLVKTDPIDGVKRAADALHNTEAMIRERYGHLSSQDRTDRAQEIIGGELDMSRAALRAKTDGGASL